MNSNNQKRTRRWLPYLGTVILIGLIAAGFWPQPMPVETAVASSGPLRATVNEEGKTRIKQRYTVSAPVSGHLRRIQLKAGDTVSAGSTLIAIIDPVSPSLLDARGWKLAQARRDSAAANLEKAEANFSFAASELKRFEKLSSSQVISAQELESAQLRETSAAKEKAAAAAALREAEAELAEFSSGDTSKTDHLPVEVKAPVSGRVLHLIEESSRVVGSGTPLLEIGDPADLEVVIETLSRDGAVITPGTKMELEQWGGGPPLDGRVRFVEPAAFTKVSALGVEEQRVNVVGDIVTPVAQRPSLGDNFRVEARIIVWETERALKVPSGALFRRGSQWAAFVIQDGQARLRPVNIGRSSGTEVQILDGIKEGDQLIVYPGDRIQDGQRVKPVKI